MWRGPKTKKKTSSQNFRHTSQTPHTPPSMQANIPDRLNAVLVPEGIARVSYVADSKMTNTGTFTFRREDHTLGNLLRMYVSPFSLTPTHPPTWWWGCWLVYFVCFTKAPLFSLDHGIRSL